MPEDKNIYLKDILENGNTDRIKSFCIDAHYYKGSSLEHYGDRIYSCEGKSTTLSANGGGRGAKTGLYLVKGVAMRTRDKGYKEVEIRKDDKTNALTTVQTDSMIKEQDIVRKLTPIECERLQTIPDNYTLVGNFEGKLKEISNSQRYKMLGNSFCCDVIVHLLSYIKKDIDNA